MKTLDVWGKIFKSGQAARNDNMPDLEPCWVNIKALYDEAHEHLKLYETLYAKAHALDMAYRHSLSNRRGA